MSDARKPFRDNLPLNDPRSERCFVLTSTFGLDNMRLKLFVRRDLFDRIVVGGFVNLTHINARRVDITWDDDDLWDLLHRRLRGSEKFIEFTKAESISDAELLGIVFPDQVDQGTETVSS